MSCRSSYSVDLSAACFASSCLRTALRSQDWKRQWKRQEKSGVASAVALTSSFSARATLLTAALCGPCLFRLFLAFEAAGLLLLSSSLGGVGGHARSRVGLRQVRDSGRPPRRSSSPSSPLEGEEFGGVTEVTADADEHKEEGQKRSREADSGSMIGSVKVTLTSTSVRSGLQRFFLFSFSL